MKLVTCFVKTSDTNKEFNLLSEEEKTELANALQAKALKALSVQAEEVMGEAEDIKEAEEESQIESTQEE